MLQFASAWARRARRANAVPPCGFAASGCRRPRLSPCLGHDLPKPRPVVRAALPGAGDDNKLVVFHINLAGKKRYILLAATAGDGAAGTYLSAIGALSRARQIPDSIAEMGALEVLRA